MAFLALRFGRRNVKIIKGIHDNWFYARNCSSDVTSALQSNFSSPELVANIDRTSNTECIEDFETIYSRKDLTRINTISALSTLKSLRKLTLQGKINPSTFNEQEKFLKICEVFESKCNKVPAPDLVLGLRCMLELGVPPESRIVRSLENEILWASRRMTYLTLCFCMDFHVNFKATEQQASVVQYLIQQIEKRWCEISEPIHVIKVLKNSSHFDKNFISKVEDRAIEFADKMTADDILSLFTIMSQQKLRPKPLMYALSYYLVQKKEHLSLRQCCNLCYILSSLHYIDSTLLNKVTQDALVRLETTTRASQVASLLSSLSLLKWDHSVLLEQCCLWLQSRISECSTRDLHSLLLSLANLNYQPECAKLLYPVILQHLKCPNEVPQMSPSVWLDMVWSLVVLGKATPKHLLSVLQATFYQDFIDKKSKKAMTNILKLQNIAAVAKVEFPFVKLPTNCGVSDVEISDAMTTTSPLTESVIEALKNFLPPPKYLASNLNTTLGFRIAAEFIVNTAGKPVPIVEYGVKAGVSKEWKPLEKDHLRIALMVWNFRDLNLKSLTTTGSNALAVRLLTKLGYTVVEVPYTEYQMLNTEVKQVQYLENKIKSVSCLQGD